MKKNTSQEEFSVLDRANRLQLTEDMLERAGIEGNRVKVEVESGKIIIEQGHIE